MPKGYQHLTLEIRWQISALKERGISQGTIAKQLGVHKSTISRELRRNGGCNGYDASYAEDLCRRRHHSAKQTKVMKLSGETLAQVLVWLEESQWSPAEISGRLKRELGISVSHELIYQHIWSDKRGGGKLYQHLRRRGKKYQSRANKYSGRGFIPHRTDIKDRPAIVEEKSRVGDWEIDLIEGGKGDNQFLVTAVERRTQLMLMKQIPDKTAEETTKAIIELLLPYKKHVHTITSDNGKEFAGHLQVQHRLAAKFFFATPYHSWERGINERTNGLVRQYFPKRSNFAILKLEDVNKVQCLLNSRPRKNLDFLTPIEAFFELTTNHDYKIALLT
jgi:IS30 family transposase